jgi:pimeloyl-ACP methyl ester carboxylesterase
MDLEVLENSLRTTKLDIRGLLTHVQEWGEPSSPKLFILHGWMDCGATFKYMMPHLSDHFHVIAPDLRGFGETEKSPEGYWFPEYFADLEVLLSHYAPTGRVNLAGHSMGGNIVLMYAGIQPDRVARVLSLEGLGLPPSEPKDAVGKYRQWMTQVLSDEPSKIYPNINRLRH